jgi:glycosyltransferase involved in cell wall biosynthesis
LKILAIIPAYNEAKRIQPVVQGSLEYLPVLVVDDGSSDTTADQARRVGAMVYSQRLNQGKGAALKAGFRYALDAGYQAVVTLDADGQHDPAEIPKFLEAYQSAAIDLIIGARNFSQIPLVRRFSNSVGRVTFSWALGQFVPDNQSGYRLASNRLMAATLSSPEQGFQFEVEMIVTCVEAGFALGWVPIRTIYAGESSHINPFRHIIEFFGLVVATRRRIRRVDLTVEEREA